jgi:hypothetical protein
MLSQARGVQFNIKLETSPNISNLTLKFLTLNPYARQVQVVKEACPPVHFVSFSKHMLAYVRAFACV